MSPLVYRNLSVDYQLQSYKYSYRADFKKYVKKTKTHQTYRVNTPSENIFFKATKNLDPSFTLLLP